MALSPPPLPSRFPCWCRAIYSWGGESKRDLGFIEGDLIECLNAGDGSWWVGRLFRDRRTVGSFPSNFVEVLPDDFRPTKTPSPVPPNIAASQPKNVPQKSRTFRKPFEAYAKAPHYTTAKQPETFRETPRSRLQDRPSREATVTSRTRGNSTPNPSTALVLARSAHEDISRAPSPAPFPASSYGSRAPSPAPSIGRPASPPPPHRHVVRAESTDATQNYQSISRAGSAVSYNPRDISRPSSTISYNPADIARQGSTVSYNPADITRHGSTVSYNAEDIIPRHGSAVSYDHYKSSQRPSNGSYTDLQNTSRQASYTSYDDGHGSQRDGYHTPRGGSSHRPSMEGSHMTPSPLREAMDGVMQQLDQLEGLGGIRESQSPERQYDPWSPESFDMVPPPPPQQRQKSRQRAARPLTSTWSGGSSQNTSQQDGHREKFYDPSQLSNYVERMEKQISRMHQHSISQPYPRPKSSAGSTVGELVSFDKKARGRRSVYDMIPGIERTNTTKTNQTNASTGNQSNSSSSTQSSGRTLSTSAGSLARTAHRTQSALSMRNDDGDRPDSPFTGVTYHSSHASNYAGHGSSIARPISQVGFHEELTPGLGGLVAPKSPKRNIFKKIFESAKTGVASNRGSIAAGHMPIMRSVSPGASMASLSGARSRRDAAREMGLGAGVDWVQVRRDVNRSNSISKIERNERMERCQMQDHPTLNPIDELYEGIEGDEGADGLPVHKPENYHMINLSQVDKNSLATLAQTYICRPYRSDLQRLRAIFTWVAEKICWEEDFEGDADTQRTIQARRGCAEEYAMLVMEMGYLKAPGDIPDLNVMPRSNHWWNAVIVDDEWRMIDACLASSMSGQSADFWWFLARPTEICWTHVPEHHDQQHIVPPVAYDTLLNLPCACPAYFKNGIQLVDFNTSLTRIEDLEMVHIMFNVPSDVEIAAEVEARAFNKDIDGDLFESGDVWFNGLKRYTGVLKSIKDIPHPLAFTLPIIHTGENPPYEFVTRHPTPHAQRHDIYVVQPQCQQLALNNTFVFAIRQHPSSISSSAHPVPFARPSSAMSINASSTSAKLAIQTPGGKILRLMRKEDRKGISVGSRTPDEEISDGGTWETIIKCSEKGLWRGLVLADRTARWCVFAEWTCGPFAKRFEPKRHHARLDLRFRSTDASTKAKPAPFFFFFSKATDELEQEDSMKLGLRRASLSFQQDQRPMLTAYLGHDEQQQQQQQQHHHLNQHHQQQQQQMYGHPAGAYFSPQMQQHMAQPQPQPQNQNQQQQFQHHGQQSMYAGGMGHEQQFYHHQNPQQQPQHGMYMQPQQFQQPAHQHQPPMSAYNVGFNGYPEYNASAQVGGHQGHHLQQAANQYLPPSNVWQQHHQQPQQQQPQRQQMTPQPMQHQPLPNQRLPHQPLPHQALQQQQQQQHQQQQHSMQQPLQQVHRQPQQPQPSPVYHTQSPAPSLPPQPSPIRTPAPPPPRLQATPQPSQYHSPVPQASPQREQQRQPTPQQQQQQQQHQYRQPTPQQQPQQQPRQQSHTPVPQQQTPVPVPQQQPPIPQPQPPIPQSQPSIPQSQPSIPPQSQSPAAQPQPAQSVEQQPLQDVPPNPPQQPQFVHPSELQQEPVHYVNMQDIQKQPSMTYLPISTASLSNIPVASHEKPKESIVKPPPPNAAPIKQEKQEDGPVPTRVLQQAPDVRIKPSPHSSMTNSPSLSMRSPSITKKSPAITPKTRPVNTAPLMIAVAEECIEKARNASHDVAMALCPNQVSEYQELVATALSCLEAALQGNNQLAPREEARVRLRYAALLQEETENLMEAETALAKGITLCDKWYYAFRLLKASFYLGVGITDAGALDNIRSIQNVANTRGDTALSVLASLIEGFTLLKTAKDGNLEKIQACIAQVAKYQFDPSVQMTQLTMLTLLLEVAASLHHQNPDHTAQKLRQLQTCLDDCEDWHNVKSDFLVPIKKELSAAKTVSGDTRAILRLGEGEGEMDYLVMTFMTKMELRSLVFTISGLVNFHKPSSQGRDSSTAGIPYGAPIPLNVAIKQRAWRTEAQAYLNVLLGLVAASHCQWSDVRQMVQTLGSLVSPSTQPTVRLLSIYLKGVYFQGIGQLQQALDIFLNSQFAVQQQGSTGIKAGHQEIALLAGLNRLWIMQHPSCRNDQTTQDLIEQLQPHCNNHTNIDLRTAWHNVMAAIVTDPPQQLNSQKQHIHAAMAGSKVTSNVLGAAVTLCIMRSRFFENVIGEQALKSARAAAKQAQRSGNVLWQSVADGMLAQSYEVQGQRDEAKQEWDKATEEARDAFSRSL
ncbi:cohesin loading factor domain-containing protein [Trichoderma sp. TUCIM 5745]